MNKLKNLLEKHGFYLSDIEMEEIVQYKDIELVKKAYGDSHSISTADEFGSDYNTLVSLANQLDIAVPDEVYYD